MWEKFIEALSAVSIWELLIIYCCRIVEVSMGTIKIILMNRGYRIQSAVLAFFEVLIWVFVASRVITGIAETPIKGIIYSLGFASGVFVGTKLEKRIAFGKVLIQVITTLDNGKVISEVLRDLGHGVTVLKGQGKDTERSVLMIYANRKGQENIISRIHEIDTHAMIVSNDISSLQGGFLGSWKRFVK